MMRLVKLGGTAALTAMVAMAVPASGALIVTEAQGDGTAWVHADPALATNGGNIPSFFTTGMSVSSGVIAQTITPTQDITIGKIDIAYTSSEVSTIGVRIAPSTTELNDEEMAYEYTAGTPLLDLTFDLSVATSGVQILTLEFTGSDQVTVQQDQEYVLEFYDAGTDGSFGLRRRGDSYYSGGMLFVNGSSFNGTNHRDAALQIFEVPEPSSLAGLGLAGVAMLARRRRSA